MTDTERILQTERLHLEPLAASHAAEMFELLSDSRLYEFIPSDPPKSLEALTGRYRRLETRSSADGTEIWLNWVLRSKAEKICLGRVEATVRKDGTAYFAYELGSAFWGKGYAAEACRRAIEALFSEYGIKQIVADVDTRNRASIRLLERLGFAQSAFRKNADFFKGASSDEYRYLLSRPA